LFLCIVAFFGEKNITIGQIEQKILSFEVRMGLVKILCFWRYVGGCRSWQSTGFAKIISKTCFRGTGEPITAHSWSWLTNWAVFQNFSFHFHLCYPFALQGFHIMKGTGKNCKILIQQNLARLLLRFLITYEELWDILFDFGQNYDSL